MKRNLNEQFEYETGEYRPVEPYSSDVEPELWAHLYLYQLSYSEWLESKLNEKGN
jgi:hypothetical protein